MLTLIVCCSILIYLLIGIIGGVIASVKFDVADELLNANSIFLVCIFNLCCDDFYFVKTSKKDWRKNKKTKRKEGKMSNISIHKSVLVGLQKIGYENFRAIKDAKGNVYVSGINCSENPIFSTYRIDYALANLDIQGWFDIKKGGNND